MKWHKSGTIFRQPHSNFSSHVQLPVVDTSHPNYWRIFYCSRDNRNRSLPFFVDIKPGCPEQIIQSTDVPLFMPGSNGSFDQDGIMPTEIIHHDNKEWLFYIGWQLQHELPYRNYIGLAVNCGEGWQKHGSPVLTGHGSTLYTGTLGVLKKQNKWLGYYLSCCDWLTNRDGTNPRYNIATASTDDLLNWQCTAETAIDFSNKNEAGICSARVIEHNGIYHMFYCYRNGEYFRDDPRHAYRIGYAQSQDAIHWQRRDELMHDFSEQDDFASVMQCYPYVIKHQQTLYMFYNGNGFGQTGLAYATLPLNQLPHWETADDC